MIKKAADPGTRHLTAADCAVFMIETPEILMAGKRRRDHGGAAAQHTGGCEVGVRSAWSLKRGNRGNNKNQGGKRMEKSRKSAADLQ